MDISILIVSYKTLKYVESAIESIITSNTKFKYEIIISDNNSNDGTCEMIKSKYPNDVILIENTQNNGFSVGMNQAFRASSGKYVMTFNPDAELFENTIEEIVSYMSTNKQIGILGVNTYDSLGGQNLPYHSFPLIQSFRVFKGLKGNTKKTNIVVSKVPFNVSWIWGSAITVKRSLLDNDKMFREDSFLFWEEYELAQRVKEKEHSIVINPNIKVCHHTSVTFKFNAQKLKMATSLSLAHGYRIRKKHFGVVKAKLSLLLKILDSVLLIGRVNIGRIVNKEKNTNERNRMLYKYSSEISTNFKCFFRGLDYVNKIDKKAKLFFNS